MRASFPTMASGGEAIAIKVKKNETENEKNNAIYSYLVLDIKIFHPRIFACNDAKGRW